MTWRHSTHNISQRRVPSTRWRTRSHSCGIARRDDDEQAMHSVGERLKGACAELDSQEQRKLRYAGGEPRLCFCLGARECKRLALACPTCLHLISSTDRGRRLNWWSDVHVYASRCKPTRSLRALFAARVQRLVPESRPRPRRLARGRGSSVGGRRRASVQTVRYGLVLYYKGQRGPVWSRKNRARGDMKGRDLTV